MWTTLLFLRILFVWNSTHECTRVRSHSVEFCRGKIKSWILKHKPLIIHFKIFRFKLLLEIFPITVFFEFLPSKKHQVGHDLWKHNSKLHPKKFFFFFCNILFIILWAFFASKCEVLHPLSRNKLKKTKYTLPIIHTESETTHFFSRSS